MNLRQRTRAPRAALALAASAIAALGLASACQTASGPAVTVQGATGSPVRVAVELATNPSSRELGLMYRDALAPDAGMLFIFPDATSRSFWMHNTKIPLDILFLNEQGRILCMHERATPFSEMPLPCEAPVRFVLEVAGGFAAEHGVQTGSEVELGSLASTSVR